MAKIKVDKTAKKKAKSKDDNQHDVCPSESVPSDIDGYKVMKLKCSEDSSATHHVLVKEHTVREKCPEKPPSRTIFVRSVPPFITEEALRNAFGTFGPVQNIYIHSAPCASLPAINRSEFFTDVPPVTGFKVAYIVYEDKESARKALLASSDTPLLLFPDGRPTSSLLDIQYQEWGQRIKTFSDLGAFGAFIGRLRGTEAMIAGEQQNHSTAGENYPTICTKLLNKVSELVEQYNKKITTDSKALKLEVDEYMLAHDQLLKGKEELEKNKRDEEEADDGWVTVTRKSGIPRKESVHNKIMKKQDKRIKKTQLLNFYRFQIRESKMTQLVKLREKFEEDKKRIAQLKESRKFKPF